MDGFARKVFHIPLLGFVFLLLVSAQSHAIGFAEAEVLSSINQPLDCRIQIISATRETLDDTDVQVRFVGGSTRLAVAGLQYEWVEESNAMYLRLTTRKDIREPVVLIAVELSWSDGRLQREYQLLLNPPKSVR